MIPGLQYTANFTAYCLKQACDNPILLDICARLWNMSELYRNWSIPCDDKRPIPAEHKTLMQAVLARDSKLAVDLYNAHIQLTIDILTENKKLLDQ